MLRQTPKVPKTCGDEPTYLMANGENLMYVNLRVNWGMTFVILRYKSRWIPSHAMLIIKKNVVFDKMVVTHLVFHVYIKLLLGKLTSPSKLCRWVFINEWASWQQPGGQLGWPGTKLASGKSLMKTQRQNGRWVYPLVAGWWFGTSILFSH